ncbi:MAG: AAA family ATPase [Bacteroidales bacterium]|nr:AAA family ATPase [Candidatus Liminaster caballi]
MSKYVDVGNAGFSSIINTGFVDKSMLIKSVNEALYTENRFMCVTRARRFGKSVAIKMLNAYYDRSCDSSVLFKNLQIKNNADFSNRLNKYPVIYLDMTEFITKYRNEKNLVHLMQNDISNDIIAVYKDLELKGNDDLMDLLTHIVDHTGQPFICLIDEWDALCRESNESLMDEYVDFLRRLFKCSKSDSVFAAVYMTGILPIKRYNTQSALNNFEEFTMLSPADLSTYFGFTEPEVRTLCEKHGMDTEQMKLWYDGYKMGDTGSIYNPYAVMRALKRGRFENYWTNTNTFEGLKRYITMNYDGLKDAVVSLLADIPVSISTLRFSNDMNRVDSKDDVLTLLCHLGYLSYDWGQNQVSIPNYEVHNEFEAAIADSGWSSVAKALHQSDELLGHVLMCENKHVATAIDEIHEANTSIINYNNENALACVLTLAFYTARNKYHIVRELPSGRGFADIVLIPRRGIEAPAIVLELKYNKSAETAISQIKQQRYVSSLSDFAGTILLVGINYDKKSKVHTCLIEEWTKSNTNLGKSNTKGNTNLGKSNTIDILTDRQQQVIDYCKNESHSANEIFLHLGIGKQAKHYKTYIKDLVSKGLLLDQTPNRIRDKRYLSI